MPTVAREPDQWALPLWLAWPPVAVGVLVAGLTGCVLSWWWASDSYSAALMTDRLIMADGTGRRRPMPDSVVPDGRWVSTTMGAFRPIGRSSSAATKGGESFRPGRLFTVREGAPGLPLNPTGAAGPGRNSSLAGGTARSIRILGLSRDASACPGARGLLDAGSEGRRCGCTADPHDRRTPIVLADRHAALQRRPVGPPLSPAGEMAVRDIAGELASRNEWTFREWSRAYLATRQSCWQPLDCSTNKAAMRPRRSSTASWTSRGHERRLIGGFLFVWAARRGPRLPIAAGRMRSRNTAQAIELIDNETIRCSW
jgi:hypothetical protein